jgi:hypothetical protein
MNEHRTHVSMVEFLREFEKHEFKQTDTRDVIDAVFEALAGPAYRPIQKADKDRRERQIRLSNAMHCLLRTSDLEGVTWNPEDGTFTFEGETLYPPD